MYTIQHAAAALIWCTYIRRPFGRLTLHVPAPSAYTISITESRATNGAHIHLTADTYWPSMGGFGEMEERSREPPHDLVSSLSFFFSLFFSLSEHFWIRLTGSCLGDPV